MECLSPNTGTNEIGDYAVTGSVTVTVGPCRLTVGAEGESTQKVLAQKPLSDFEPATKCCKIIDDKTNGNTLTVIKNSWTLLDTEDVGACGFPDDEELYAEKARKQREMRQVRSVMSQAWPPIGAVMSQAWPLHQHALHAFAPL